MNVEGILIPTYLQSQVPLLQEEYDHINGNALIYAGNSPAVSDPHTPAQWQLEVGRLQYALADAYVKVYRVILSLSYANPNRMALIIDESFKHSLTC